MCAFLPAVKAIRALLGVREYLVEESRCSVGLRVDTVWTSSSRNMVESSCVTESTVGEAKPEYKTVSQMHSRSFSIALECSLAFESAGT